MRVKKLNVVKQIDESRLPEYEAKGYKPIIETQAEDIQQARYACPHCDKDYATEAGLSNHIKEKHPETQTH